MIDSKTGEKIIVKIHDEYGPYISVSNYSDGGSLEDLFDDKYYILYWNMTPKELIPDGGNEYYFGNAADPVKLQILLDSIK